MDVPAGTRSPVPFTLRREIRPMPDTPPTELQADSRFWLEREGRPFLGHSRAELLEHIDATGSIAEAARAMGMSYKNAWDTVDAMNNLAEEALVERQKGGRHGGGSSLTEYGRRAVGLFRELERIHARLLSALAERRSEAAEAQALYLRLGLTVSASNQLLGRVREVLDNGRRHDVVLDIGGLPLRARLTRSAISRLSLAPERAVMALIKATTIKVYRHDMPQGDNVFRGVIESDGDSDHLAIRLNQGRVVYATGCVDAPRPPAAGTAVWVSIDPEDVMLAVADPALPL